MSKSAYYSPAILGALAALIYAMFGGGDYTQAERGLIAGIGAPAGALVCQLLMLAAQGVFAGVLPVPSGRTLRGKVCGAIGVLILVGLVLGAMSGLASRGQTGRLVLVFAAAGATCGLAAAGLYVWWLPTAKADFEEPAPA